MITNRIVKKTMQRNNIEIYHHLTYGNSLWPVSNFGQKQFFIWGPIEELRLYHDFIKHYNFKGQVIELRRKTIVKIVIIFQVFHIEIDVRMPI